MDATMPFVASLSKIRNVCIVRNACTVSNRVGLLAASVASRLAHHIQSLMSNIFCLVRQSGRDTKLHAKLAQLVLHIPLLFIKRSCSLSAPVH